MYMCPNMMCTETFLLFSRQHSILFSPFFSTIVQLAIRLFAAHTFGNTEDIYIENILGLLFIGNKQRSAAYFPLSFSFFSLFVEIVLHQASIDICQVRRSFSATKQQSILLW